MSERSVNSRPTLMEKHRLKLHFCTTGASFPPLFWRNHKVPKKKNVTLTASSPLPPPFLLLHLPGFSQFLLAEGQRPSSGSATQGCQSPSSIPPTPQPRAPTLQPGPGIPPLSKQGTVVQGQRGSWKCRDEDGHKRGKWKRGRNKRQG